MKIGKYKLERTCGFCPEQYNVHLDDEKVGYLRLRHGHFRAECKGETVYEASPNGDGGFDYDERDSYLNAAIEAIDKKLNEKT